MLQMIQRGTTRLIDRWTALHCTVFMFDLSFLLFLNARFSICVSQCKHNNRQISNCVNFNHQFGDIHFTACNSLEDVILQIKCCNDLWYHSDLHIVQDKDASEIIESESHSEFSPPHFGPRINFV